MVVLGFSFYGVLFSALETYPLFLFNLKISLLLSSLSLSKKKKKKKSPGMTQNHSYNHSLLWHPVCEWFSTHYTTLGSESELFAIHISSIMPFSLLTGFVSTNLRNIASGVRHTLVPNSAPYLQWICTLLGNLLDHLIRPIATDLGAAFLVCFFLHKKLLYFKEVLYNLY